MKTDANRYELLWVTIYTALVASMVATAVNHIAGLYMLAEALDSCR